MLCVAVDIPLHVRVVIDSLLHLVIRTSSHHDGAYPLISKAQTINLPSTLYIIHVQAVHSNYTGTLTCTCTYYTVVK